MSRSWRPTRLITAAELFGGRLEKHGVRESIVEPKDMREYYAGLGIKLPEEAPGGMMPGTTEHSRCLTDGKNFMWVEISNRGFVADITRYGGNDPNDILWAIDQEFEAGLIDEEHPDYWEGCEGEVVAVPLEDFECSRNHQGTSCQTIAPCADKRHPRAHPFTPVIRVDLVVVGPLPVYLLQPTFRPRMGTEPARRARVQYLTGKTTIGDAAN